VQSSIKESKKMRESEEKREKAESEKMVDLFLAQAILEH
jgi:hypothetical protein